MFLNLLLCFFLRYMYGKLVVGVVNICLMIVEYSNGLVVLFFLIFLMLVSFNKYIRLNDMGLFFIIS